MRRTLCALLVSAAVALFAFPLFAASGDASGTVTINQKKIAMKFAYAKTAADTDGKTITVVLTDKPATRSLLGDENRVQKAVAAGELQLLTLEFDADGTLKQAALRSTQVSNKTFPLMGSKIDFTKTELSAGAIAGKAKSSETQTFFDDSASVDVVFSAALGKEKFADSASALKQLAAKAPKIGAGGAVGTLAFDKETTKLTHAFAVSEPNAFDGKKTDVVVYLTDRPIDGATIRSHRKLAKAVEAGLRGLVVSIDETETPVHLELLRKEASIQLSGTGIFNFDPLQFDRTRVEGRFFTTKNEDFMDHNYSYDVTFRSEVRDVSDPRLVVVDSKTGKKLPADGGDPGKAFFALDKAIRGGSIAEIVKLSAKDVDSPLDSPPEEQKQMLDIIKMMQPAKIRIVDGWSNEQLATLRVTGVDPTEKGKKVNGTVHLALEDGAWKVVAQKWRM